MKSQTLRFHDAGYEKIFEIVQALALSPSSHTVPDSALIADMRVLYFRIN
jgi:hypothetical protein